MEDGYCCSCAEVIWNPLPFGRILSQVRGYIKNNYSDFVLQAWDKQIKNFLLKKHEHFESVSFCPHCAVSLSKRFLESITRKEDENLGQFLEGFENI